MQSLPSIATCCLCLFASSVATSTAFAQAPDRIVHHAKIVTVDPNFQVAEAMALSGERIVAIGQNDAMLKLADSTTELIDLQGKTVLPGLIDSHVHATGAAEHEFDHTIPEMLSIADVLQYIRGRAEVLEDGEWISVGQVFVTRLNEQRFPTRSELDSVAPNNPVYFRTGPDAALNSLALKLSGIDRDFKITDGEPGYIETDPTTGEPTGILRSCTRLAKVKSPERKPSPADRRQRLVDLLHDYNSVGITSIADRAASDDAIAIFKGLRDDGQLSCRVFLSYSLNAQSSVEQITAQVKQAATSPLHDYNNMLWLRGAKIFLDGGMLTGSAYMRQPWGVSSIYAINDPNYRGLLYVEAEKLYQIAKVCLENDIQITAHSVGDGAVHALIDAYEQVNLDTPVAPCRPCITHCNFMSAEAIERMSRLGIVADIQPVWLWLDGKTLLRQFGEERTEYFQPYRKLFDSRVICGGGSDHMQKIGSMRSVNPYNPFLGIWITQARIPRGMNKPLHPEHRITREEAIRFYTINNAYLTFEEQEKGSLEPTKLADFIVLDRDILTCPVDEIRDIQVERTYLGGKLIYSRK
ncbi:MAG: amidohydrolase [Pirellulaceae bacterium]|nr:amidohydrolase [Pirellulaceae bacterium]